jgi:hypothetical protein
MGGYGMLCVMRVLDEFELKEATNLVSSPQCIKRDLDEFPGVMPEELLDELTQKANRQGNQGDAGSGTSCQGFVSNES